MLRFAWTAILVAMLLTACSHSQSTPEELKSDAAELISIAAEGELFASFVAQGRATAAFVKGHPEYLRKQLKDLRKDLDKENPDPRLENSLAALQKLSRQLDGMLAELPVTPHDPRWPDLATDFARVARTAENLRRTL